MTFCHFQIRSTERRKLIAP